MIIERLGQVSDSSLQSHCRPKLPIAAQAQGLIRTTATFVAGPPENNGTGVRHRIGVHEVVSAFLSPVRKKVRRPSLRVQIIQVPVPESILLIGFSYTPRPAIRKHDRRVRV